MSWQTEKNYFKRMIGKKASWTISQPEDGLVRAGYPLYDQEVLDFVQRFRKSKLYNHHYRRTLRHYHIRPRLTARTVSQALLIHNTKAAGAMLSFIIDNEDVQRGTWAAAMQNGYIYHLLEVIDPDSDRVAQANG